LLNDQEEDALMKLVSAFAVVCLVSGTAAFAQSGPASILSSVPPNSATVTNYYKQDVYDTGDHKIGDIKDVLVDRDGKVTALIIGAGGFLGMGEHDVAVPFDAVKGTQKDGKWYLTMNSSKETLKAAPGLKYDRTNTTWIPENASTTGSNNR
jgi:sporulation protein YlmC with PRC-barrel domain